MIGTIKQLGSLVFMIFVVCSAIIGLGTAFPNGELLAGAGELWEAIQQLLSAAGNAISGAV